MALHKTMLVTVDLPSGNQANLPSFCADALDVEIVKVPGKDGDEFVVGLKVPDLDSQSSDPRENDEGFGEFKEFTNTEKMDAFLSGLCRQDFKLAASQAGWKKNEDGTILKEGSGVTAVDWEEACDLSEMQPILVPDKLMFMVDKYEHGLVRYVADMRDVALDDNGAGVFIPCDDVQEKYKEQVASGVSVSDARAHALADTNRGLDEFSAWCNGEVYGVCDYRFDGTGQKLDEGEEGWGYIGSACADEELADRLFIPRVEAQAAQIGLDPDKRQNLNAHSGEYVGKVLAADKTAGILILSGGCGQWSGHSMPQGQVPEIGQKMELKYKCGVVATSVERPSDKELGR